MEKYLILTKHNEEKSNQFRSAINLIGLEIDIIDEFFSPEYDKIRLMGVQNVPSMIAIYENKVIHQTDSTQEFAGFSAAAQAKLDELLSE